MISVEAERCFSALKSINTFLKNSMSTDRFPTLAMLSIKRKMMRVQHQKRRLESIYNLLPLIIDEDKLKIGLIF